MHSDDARLMELEFLAHVERNEPFAYQGYVGKPSRRDQMVVTLLHDGYLNDYYEAIRTGHASTALERREQLRSEAISQFVRGAQMQFWISHKGRVRLSELRQQIRIGRDRDETGLLWAKRHLLTDLSIEVLSLADDARLTVVFLDMNGLGAINNTYGHSAGDEAIRSFFQSVLSTIGQRGDAYRNGGDEVVALLPGVDEAEVRVLLDAFVKHLEKDELLLGDGQARTKLTASCGSATVRGPNQDAAALCARADQTMYRAKDASKRRQPRVSAIAIGDSDVQEYPAKGPA